MNIRYRKLSDWTYFFGFLPLASKLPPPLSYTLARAQGRYFCRVQDDRRKEIEANLRSALPNLDAEQLQALLVQTFENQTVEEMETFHIRSKWNSWNVNRYFSFAGTEFLEEAQARGKGVILMTAHFGAYCSGFVGFGLKGNTLHFLAHNSPEDITFHPALRAYGKLKIEAMQRACKGESILFQLGSNASSSGAVRTVLEKLKQNQLVGVTLDVVPDQLSATAEVTFLQRQCRFPVGFLKIANRAGCPIVPFFTLRDEKRPHKQTVYFGKGIQPSGSLSQDLQLCLIQLEAVLLANPNHWLCWDSLRRFESRPPLV